MTGTAPTQGAFHPQVALCVESGALDRLGAVLRHLVVGLVDQAIPLRLVSDDPRIGLLSVGPGQALIHKRIRWPVADRRVALVIETLETQPPDAVHALSAGSYELARTAADELDAECVLQVTSRADVRAIGRLGEDTAGRFLAFTEPLARAVEEAIPSATGRVELVRPGTPAAAERACFSTPEQTPTLVSFARFGRGAGVERLVVAADLLRQRGREFMLFLLGAGPREAAVRRLIRDRKLTSVVTLSRPDGDRGQVMSNADILVEPAATGSFHSATLEALAAGVAVVAAEDAMIDFLRPGETAVICTDPAAESLADAVDGLLLDPDRARQLADAGMEYVRRHHTVSGMAQRTAEAYRQLTFKRATYSITE